jgi:hypothetical protein
MTIATADVYDERGDALDSLSLQLHDVGGRVALTIALSRWQRIVVMTPSNDGVPP